jgi:DNA-binding NtrC family response regulator
MSSLRALLISSDGNNAGELAAALAQCGVSAVACSGWAPARVLLMEPATLDLLICEDRLHDGSFRDVLAFSKDSRVKLPVIVYSPSGDFAAYLEAMESGAFDFMVPPYRLTELQAILTDLERQHARNQEATATISSNEAN